MQAMRVFSGLFSFAFIDKNNHSFPPHSAVFSSFMCKYPAFLEAGAMIVLLSFVISMVAVLKQYYSPWSVTEAKLSLLAAQQANESERQDVKARNTTLFRKPSQKVDGRLMSQNNHLLGPGSQALL